jgi:hypothetical protein
VKQICLRKALSKLSAQFSAQCVENLPPQQNLWVAGAINWPDNVWMGVSIEREDYAFDGSAGGRGGRTAGCVRQLMPDIREIAAGSFRRKEPPEIQESGHVVRSLEAALWALYKSENFRDGCLLAANQGDDADTTAAVYGRQKLPFSNQKPKAASCRRTPKPTGTEIQHGTNRFLTSVVIFPYRFPL